MLEVRFDNKEFKETMTFTEKQMVKYKDFISFKQSHFLASAAVRTMHEGVSRYFSKHYNLAAGKTRQLALFAGGGASMEDFAWAKGKARYKKQQTLAPTDVSKFRVNGRRLISFSFEAPVKGEGFSVKSLHIHSFPMNLYERDVMLGGWAKGTIRKGTHIMRGLLPGEAQAQMANAKSRFEAELTAFFRRQETS